MRNNNDTDEFENFLKGRFINIRLDNETSYARRVQ